MLLDTNFLIDLEEETAAARVGRARAFLGRHRNRIAFVSVISLGELAAGMEDNESTRRFLSRFRVASLKPEMALRAAAVDRALLAQGLRLGENDTWLAGVALYYGVPIVSADSDFDRVDGLRRISY
jgi:predicted nucleic acid-binding protein